MRAVSDAVSIRPTWRWLPVLACCAALAGISGCGGGNDGPKRYGVSGTVTYDGKPVPRGFIIFEPDSSKGNSGPGGGASIVDGRFATESGKGTVGGPHIVKVTGYDGVPTTNEEGMELPEGEELFDLYETTADFPKDEDAELELDVVPESSD